MAFGINTVKQWGKSVIGIFAGYDAVDSKGRRKAPTSILQSEDRELRGGKRRALVGGARDMRRNFAVVAWAIRKHLDYVSTFSFHAKTGIPDLDKQMNDLWAWFSKPENCDIAGRHSLQRMIRLCEAGRCIDGDVFLLKLAGGFLQAIEGDRVRTPTGERDTLDDKLIEGVRLDSAGAALAFAVHSRTGAGSFKFERYVSAGRILHHAFFDRFDQVRGITPIAAALNSWRDTYEAFDYALAKIKVAQMFGLVLTRQALDSAGKVEEVPVETEEGEDADTTGKPRYEVDFGKGPILLDMEVGDDAKFLENKTPATETSAFLEKMMAVALSSLDIPYSFWDVSRTTYSGGRMDSTAYEQSADAKRADVKALLQSIAMWRFTLFILDGKLTLPAGMVLSESLWEFTPAGTPWIDGGRETNGEISQIGACLDNFEDVAKKHGKDVYKNIAANARVLQAAKEAGVPVNLAFSPAQNDAATDPSDTGDSPPPARRAA